MIVVFDSSPIIFLSRLDIIDKALSLFKTSYIPEKAIEEIFQFLNIARRSTFENANIAPCSMHFALCVSTSALTLAFFMLYLFLYALP